MLLVSLALAGSIPTPPASVSPLECDFHGQVAEATRQTSDADVMRGLTKALQCPEGTGLPLEGLFGIFERLQDLVDPTREDFDQHSAWEVARRSLLVAEVSQRFDQAPLLGNMVGIALELQSLEVLRSAFDRLDQQEQYLVQKRAAALGQGPVPQLSYERQSMVDMSAVMWDFAPFTSWCVAEHDRATRSLETILHTPSGRGEALQAWLDANPRNGWMPWTRAGESCRAGLGTVLLDWHHDRVRADAGWAELSRHP